LLSYFLFAIGLYLLVKGADWLVDGASSIALRYKIPELVIGLTIVAFGTSAPELVVNLLASFAGKSEIAVGNILGSNMANILLILGVAALIYPLKVAKSTAKIELPFSIGAAAVTGILAHNFFCGSSALNLSRLDGAALLVLFVVFWIYTFRLTMTNRKANTEAVVEPTMSISKSVLLISVGITGLFLGGKWVVDGAVEIARAMDLSEGLIAVTLVAIGTSLPELATSISAARKKKADIITGNAVGSNIFNILWVLGLSSTINPIPYERTSDIDVVGNLIVGALMLVCLMVGKRFSLSRWNGVLFLSVYAGYILFSVVYRTGM
jgi:cation:H+ antiporter